MNQSKSAKAQVTAAKLEETKESPLHSKVEYVNLDKMFADPAYQRDLVDSQVRRLVENLDLGAIGILCVSARKNDTYAIMDGQHRHEALKLSGFVNDEVEAEVFRDLTIEQEARIFRERNTRKVVQATELFRSRVVEGDPDAIAMFNLLNKHGWAVSSNETSQSTTGKGGFRAINALIRSYAVDKANGTNGVDKAMYVLTSAWGHDSAALTGPLFEAVAKMFQRYNDAINIEDLWHRLAAYEGGPRALVGHGRTLKGMYGGNLTEAIAEAVVAIYNQRRSSTRLPAWRV